MKTRYIIEPAENGFIVRDVGPDSGTSWKLAGAPHVFETFAAMAKWLEEQCHPLVAIPADPK